MDHKELFQAWKAMPQPTMVTQQNHLDLIRSDIIGRTFGPWKVSHEIGKATNRSYRKFACVCPAQHFMPITIGRLMNGTYPPCIICDPNAKKNLKIESHIDLSGRWFGSWVVLKGTPKRASGKLWQNCQCLCGRQDMVRTYNLLAGRSTGCRSCIKKERYRVSEQKKKDAVAVSQKQAESYTAPTKLCWRPLEQHPIPIPGVIDDLYSTAYTMTLYFTDGKEVWIGGFRTSLVGGMRKFVEYHANTRHSSIRPGDPLYRSATHWVYTSEVHDFLLRSLCGDKK